MRDFPIYRSVILIIYTTDKSCTICLLIYEIISSTFSIANYIFVCQIQAPDVAQGFLDRAFPIDMPIKPLVKTP